MSATTIPELDELIKKATSETIPNGEVDLPVALETSDVIRSKKIPPRECMRCLKKRITATASNPNTQLSSWKLVDICIKNGGIPFIVEICSREFMDFLENTIVKYNNDGNEIEFTIKKIFYELYITFKNDSQLNYVSRVYDKLLNSKGVTFSDELKGNVAEAKAMFDSKVPADWIDSDACMICSNKFSFLNRRHHCRSCGGIFCQEHSSNFIPLPDLGIYENVRVCDNCFSDYDSKKSSSPRKKYKKKHKKRNIDNDEEDEQLRRAIELSLKESRGDAIEPVVPVIEPERPASSNNVEEENDPELKAAIEASLREAEEERQRRERQQQQQQQQQQYGQQPNYEQPIQQPVIPSFDFSSEDEDAIYLFASMVEKMKTQTVAEVLQNDSAQRLYERVLASKPKLNHALADKSQKYNSLLEMNGKISDIMNIYDNLLEKQLRNINLSSQYSIPTSPVMEQPQIRAQPQTLYAYYQQPTQQVPIPQSPVAQQVQPSTLDQLRSVEIASQTTTPTQVPYPIESQQPLDEMIEPSEPVYPNDEDATDVKQEETQLPTENIFKGQEPIENGSTPASPQKVKTKTNITHYDFPTVPVQKLPDQQQPVEETEICQEEEPKEEPVLIEL